jgi:hypothetical protein
VISKSQDSNPRKFATIGFRAKTARAIAIALDSGSGSATYLARWEVALHDPKVPATSQPHHHVMELPWAKAQGAVAPLERRIESVAVKMLAGLLADLQSRGFDVSGVGVVGSPDRDLERLGNRHMRAHAAEGILFRRVLETAAIEHKLPCRSFSDRNLGDLIPEKLIGTLAAIGHAAGRPWRADERAAAVAAWFMI